jgi:hypothetical protein
MATTPGQWPLTFSRQRTRGLIMSLLVHLSYNLLSDIITIWLPNQDNVLFGKRRFKLLSRIQAHLRVKRKPCQGYGRLLAIVALPMVCKFTLNAKFLHVSRFSSLNNKAIISVVFNKMENQEHYDMWDII